MADVEYARFESMTNVELRAELKRRGCSTSGNKKDLLAKLRTALEKEYEQQNETPIIYTNLSVNIEQINHQVSITPEKKTTRASSKKSSIDSEINEISPTTSINNVEINSIVSKSNEEIQKNIENIGEQIHLTSNGSSNSNSDKTESIIKEIPSSDEQQPINQSETNTTLNNINDENKDESSKSVDLPAEPIIKQQEIPKENENNEIKVNRSSLMKISNRSTINKINLTTELLRTLISDLSLISESIINDELDSEENDYLSSDSMTIGELADQKQQQPTTNRTVAIDDISTRKKINSLPARIPSFESKTNNNNNNIVTDEPVRIKDVTKSSEPPSEILYIRGLTRPFSLMQLKGLLNRYGTLIDGEFWLDKIKSQCFVTYHTLDEAQNAREGLDGCRWPSTNPKILSVRFARQEEFEYSKTHDAPPEHISNDSTDRIVEELTSPIDEIESKKTSDEIKLQKEKESAFLITDDEEDEEQTVKPNEQSMKGLDDYFRKTKVKPSIYWLPLTEEEILERNRLQEQRKAQRDEEQRKREIDDNIRKPDKRKYSSSPSRRNSSKRH